MAKTTPVEGSGFWPMSSSMPRNRGVTSTRRAITSAIRSREVSVGFRGRTKGFLKLRGGPQSTIGQRLAAKIAYSVRPPVRKSSFPAVPPGLLFRLTAFEASG